MKKEKAKKDQEISQEQTRRKKERQKENLERFRNEINNFQTQNRIYNIKETKKPIMEEIQTITLEETKYPFVTMQTNRDGNCGFIAIARHYYPHLRTCNKELIKYARDLKTASKKYILDNWDENTERELGINYDYLRKGDLKENYIKHHHTLEMCHLDILALSKILKTKFLILVIPEDASPSLTEICHKSFEEPEKLHTQLLLQTEGKTQETTYRSHYEGLEPITMINNTELEQKNKEQIEKIMRNNAKYKNKYANYTNVRNKGWRCDYIPTNRVNVDGTKESVINQIIEEYKIT